MSFKFCGFFCPRLFKRIRQFNIGGLIVRRVKKPVFFIIVGLIAAFTLLNWFGISSQNGDIIKTYIKSVDDIRWGIDIRGGVDATFSPAGDIDATDLQLEGAKTKVEQRLIKLNITDYEVYVDDKNDRIVVRFPWQSGDTSFDPEAAVKELGETALLTFREGHEIDEAGLPTGITAENIILQGEDVKSANPIYNKEDNSYSVQLELADSGKEAFSEATGRLVETKGIISIWMDDQCISYPSVSAHITDGIATISGNFTAEEVISLANKINAGALPFALETSSLNILSPTDGMSARNAMLISGAIAFVLIAIYIIFLYKLPGCVAVIALFGQVVGTVAFLTGFFGVFNSFTLTIPGIAGIILAIGIGVDANIITAERIKEELRKGKSLDGSIKIGYSKAFTAIFDGNITVVLVALILMGSFGPPDSFMSKALSWLFFAFGPTTAGTIYSFGYTLLIGVILNFVFGVLCSRLMLTSLSNFKALRKPKLYGGVNND